MRTYLWAISALVFGLAAATAEAGPITFGYTGGVVDYTVPTSGPYAVKISGAQGGSIADNLYIHGSTGGLGATVGGILHLQAGQTLEVAVGQQGILGGGFGLNGTSPGGGGGSFLVLDNGGTYVPLAIAGGGGGAGYYDHSPGGAGQAGQLGGPAACGATTTAGNGGPVSTCTPQSYPAGFAGGGGGFYTSGASYNNEGHGGASFLGGLAGGKGPDPAVGNNGGFGGGGSGSVGSSGGGGGGYTGGGAGGGVYEYKVYDANGSYHYDGILQDAGSGGGSYFTAPGTQTIAISGDHGGNGAITIARFDGSRGSFAAANSAANPAGTVTANVTWDTTPDLSAYQMIGGPIPITGNITVNGKVQFVAPSSNFYDMGGYTVQLTNDNGDVLFSKTVGSTGQQRFVSEGETAIFDLSDTANILSDFYPPTGFDYSMLPSLHMGVIIHNVAELGNYWSLNDLSISGQMQMGYIATDHVALPGEDEPGDVPEPAMLSLFGMGAIGLGLGRRRRAA